MRLFFLGTAAAEGYPGIFCDCANCREARELGGRNLRMRSAGMLHPGGRLIAHHMSHSANPTHEKVEAVLCPHGVEVAYDGLEINL